MNIKMNWQAIFRETLEQGFTLLLYSLATVLHFFGLPFFLAGAVCELKDPCFHVSSTVESKRGDFSTPSDSDMIISDIHNLNSGSCWTVSFPMEIHCIDETRISSPQKEHFYCTKASISLCKNDKMKLSNEMHVERAVDKLLQCGSFDCGDLITVSFLNDGNDDSVTTSGFEDDMASESDDSVAEYSDLESFSSYLDDSDDLEVVFDDTVDACNWPDKFCHFVYADDILDMTNSLGEIQDNCQGKVFPSVTEDCHCVGETDVFSVYAEVGSEDFLGSHLKQNFPKCASSYICPENSNKSGNFGDLNKKKVKKAVSFAAKEQLVTVHPMVKWNFAYRSARKGPWERYACDRFHFQSRIQSCEQILGPILERMHSHYLSKNV